MIHPLSIAYPGTIYHIIAGNTEQIPVFKIKMGREICLEYPESESEKYNAVQIVKDVHLKLKYLLNTKVSWFLMIIQFVDVCV